MRRRSARSWDQIKLVFKLFADAFDVKDDRLGAFGPAEKNWNLV